MADFNYNGTQKTVRGARLYDILTETGEWEKPGYFTIAGLKTYPGVTARKRIYTGLNSFGTKGQFTMTGVYLEDLLKDVLKLTSNAESITVTASDNYHREFNLDSEELGVYWTDNDGNKLMLAWQENGTDCALRLVVGQTDPDHANRPMWVSGIVSITVNAKTVTPGGGTPGSYEGSKGNGGGRSEPANTVSAALKASVQITNGTANAANTAREIRDTLAVLDSGGAGVTQKMLSVDARTQQSSDKTVYTLAADALEVLINDGNTGIKLHMNQGTLMLGAELFGFLEDSGTGELTIEIAQGDLNGAPCAADITVRRGDAVISELGGFLLKAELEYDAPDTHSQPGIVVCRAGEDGLKTIVKLAAYSGGSVKMALSHLSRYEVSYNPVTFADIMNHWGRSGIEFLAARDIVKGYQDGLFSPDGLITREEMAVMTERFIAAVGYKLKNTHSAAEYTDSQQIGAFAADTVSTMRRYGVMGGNPDGTFLPKDTATRAQAARVIAALIEAVVS